MAYPSLSPRVSPGHWEQDLVILSHLTLERLLSPPQPKLPHRVQGQLKVATQLCLGD